VNVSTVRERHATCPICHGDGVIPARGPCSFVRCLPCLGRGYFFVTMDGAWTTDRPAPAGIGPGVLMRYLVGVRL
jgi:hypothetical protein